MNRLWPKPMKIATTTVLVLWIISVLALMPEWWRSGMYWEYLRSKKFLYEATVSSLAVWLFVFFGCWIEARSKQKRQ